MASAEKILFDLDPQYDDQLLPFCVSEKRVKEVCDYRRFENSDLMNLKIAVAGFGALIEVANLVMGARDQRKGIQDHDAKMSFSPVIERLEKQETDIDHLRSAYGFLEQAETYLRPRDYKELKEALGKVNTSATYALHSSGTTKVDDLVMATKLLILVDVFSLSLKTTIEKNDYTGIQLERTRLVPINNLDKWKRESMLIRVAGHLQRLVKILNKKNLPIDSVRKVLTLSYQSEDDGKAHEIYDKCALWVAPKIEIVDKDTIKVTLPPLDAIPDAGAEDFAIVSFQRENGTIKHAAANNSDSDYVNSSDDDDDDKDNICRKHTLSVCIEERQQDKFLNIGYFGIIYSLPLIRFDSEFGISKFTEDDEMIEVTLKNSTIISTSAESTLERYRDMTEFEEIWTPMDIRCIGPGAESGNVKRVKSLALCYEPRYAINDIWEAKKIVKVTKSLYLSGASLPDNMYRYDMWRQLANAVDSEIELFIFVGSFDDEEAVYEIENQPTNEMEDKCDWHVGRLVTMAKKTGLRNIKFRHFTSFYGAVSKSVAEEGNTCEEIGFKWNSECNMQEEVQQLMEQIGWKKKENPDPQYDMVIVK